MSTVDPDFCYRTFASTPSKNERLKNILLNKLKTKHMFGALGYLDPSLLSDSGCHRFDNEWLKSLPFKYAFDGKGLF